MLHVALDKFIMKQLLTLRIMTMVIMFMMMVYYRNALGICTCCQLQIHSETKSSLRVCMLCVILTFKNKIVNFQRTFIIVLGEIDVSC